MDRAKFYAALRRRDSGLFGTKLSQGQVDGMEGMLDAFVTDGDGKATTLAYGFATAYHETGRRMVPVREGFATTDAGARRAVNDLAKKRGPKSAVALYAQPAGPYGHVYYGRGRVQETWITNYRASGEDIGVDLVKNPDLHLDPVIDARILWRGLLDGRWNGSGKGLRYYLDRGDIVGARRTVNIQDQATTIAGYHRAFLKAIEKAGGAPKKPQAAPQAPAKPSPVPSASPTPQTPPAAPPAGFWARLAAFLASIFKKG